MSKLFWGKWSKYKIMKLSNDVTSHLPETTLFHREVLWRYLHQCADFVLKPSAGKQGYGVILVGRKEDGRIELHIEKYKMALTGIQQAFHDLMGRVGSRTYIIQQRIHLAENNGQPFSIRVVAQRTSNSPWEVTGMFARVAKENYFVTNASAGILPVETVLRRSAMTPEAISDRLAEINNISLQASRWLGRYYPKACMIGCDIGIDVYGRVWIIEANLQPDLYEFRKLKDGTMFRNIKRMLKLQE